jgi:hypothetical protein
VGSGLEYGTVHYTVFVFESSGSAQYAVVQVPLRFRFDREVLVFSQAAPLPEVGWGRGKENKRASGRAGERRLRSLVSCARAITHTYTHIHTGRDPQKHIRTHMHTQRYRRTHKHAHAFLNPKPFLACVRALRA